MSLDASLGDMLPLVGSLTRFLTIEVISLTPFVQVPWCVGQEGRQRLAPLCCWGSAKARAGLGSVADVRKGG